MNVKLTIRHGSRVRRETFESADAAIAAMADAAGEVSRDGQLPAVKMLREFEPADRVAARLEVSTGGVLGGKAAGIDVMGDGSLVAYAGGLRRRRIEPRPGESPFDAVRRELAH